MVHKLYRTMPSKYQVAVPLHMAISGFGQPGIQYLEDIAIDPVDTKTLYAAFAGIFKSQDEGESWTQVYKMPTVLSILVDPKDSATIYAGHEMEGVLKSTDGGKTWEQTLSAHFIYEMLIDRTGNVFAASAGGLFRTSDQGENWEKISNDFLLSLVAHPTEDSVLYGTSAKNSAGTEQLLKSNDGGHTWSIVYKVSHKGPEKSILAPKVPLVIDPKNPSTMYLGTIGDGVLKTVDAGRTWSGMNKGLPNIAIISLAIDHENPAIVFSGTEAGEVFRIVQTK